MPGALGLLAWPGAAVALDGQRGDHGHQGAGRTLKPCRPLPSALPGALGCWPGAAVGLDGQHGDHGAAVGLDGQRGDHGAGRALKPCRPLPSALPGALGLLACLVRRSGWTGTGATTATTARAGR